MSDEYRLYLQLFQGKSSEELRKIADSSDYAEPARSAALHLLQEKELQASRPESGSAFSPARKKPQPNNLTAFGLICKILAGSTLLTSIVLAITNTVLLNVIEVVILILMGVGGFLLFSVLGMILCHLGKKADAKKQ
ncbi:MAG: hypothetical protein J5825_10410 [Lachnospiraceae bacterium]|nr:hypothetical protein [Lachnospiraceae bacterium]